MSSCDVSSEVFDVFDCDDCGPIGSELRTKVHATGLWHRSTHVLVFNKAGELLIQKRSERKDVCPGLWDLSCAEHVAQGETYQQAAVRGLREELNVERAESDLSSFRPKIEFRHESETTKDFEHNEAFVTTCEDFVVDGEEVAEAKFVEVDALLLDMKENGEKYTPWFHTEMQHYSAHRAAQQQTE